ASMLDAGHVALPWDLAFPEVFSRDENGFDAVISNPPWDIMQPNTAGFLTAFDLSVLDTSDARSAQKRLLDDPVIAGAWHAHRDCFARQQRIVDRLYSRHRRG